VNPTKGLYWIGNLATTLLALMLSVTTASACRPVADWYKLWAQQSLEQKIAGSNVVFIGTVRSVVDNTVRLNVDVPIRGINADVYEVRSGGTDCDVVFAADQRWLYAGMNIFSGSIELSAMALSELRELQSIMLRHFSQMSARQKNEAKNLCMTGLDDFIGRPPHQFLEASRTLPGTKPRLSKVA
jgi:hypothetical protein